MKTLELKDICGYLPHGLNVILDSSIDEVAAAEQSDTCLKFAIKLIGDLYFLREGFKPILRPLSDLYRTITHNREEIIPIVECANIYNPGGDWILHEGNENYKKPCACSAKSYNGFTFNDGAFYEFYMIGRDVYLHHINKMSYLLFDYLHELKIDYRGLIESGLAIDVNTLENHPYK